MNKKHNTHTTDVYHYILIADITEVIVNTINQSDFTISSSQSKASLFEMKANYVALSYDHNSDSIYFSCAVRLDND